jgi:3-hydroxyacyl-[acyl-carrier protein] dehydratase/trans-2-decenoyl-[acyl-carrier protein] isomerase
MLVNAPPRAAEREPMEPRRSSFEYEDLLACGRGEMFRRDRNLPLPPMLMFDRITEIAERAANTARGWCGRCSM